MTQKKGFALLSLSGILIKIISLVFIPSILAIFSNVGTNGQAYGIFMAANQVFTFAYVITNSGTLNAITKMIAEYVAIKSYEETERAFEIARLALAIGGIIIGVALYCSAGWIAGVMGFPEAEFSIKVLAPSVFLTSVISGYRGYFQGRKDFTARATSQLIEQIVHVVAALILAYIGVSITTATPEMRLVYACAGANAGATVAAFVAMVYLMWYMHRYRKKNDNSKVKLQLLSHKNDAWNAFKLFAMYSIPITLSAGLQNLGTVIDAWNVKSRLMVSGVSHALAQDLYGQLNRSQQLIQVPVIIIVALASVVLPSMAAARARNDIKEFKSNMEYAYRWCFLVALPAAFGLGALAYPIFETCALRDGADLLMYGFIITVLMGLVQIQSSILQGMTKMYTLAGFLLIGIAAKIGINYFLVAIPEIRMLGAIIGSVVSYVIPIVLNEWYIRKNLPFKISISKFIIKPLFASVVMAVLLVFGYDLIHAGFVMIFGQGYLAVAVSTLICVALGVLVYGAIMCLVGGFTKADYNKLPDKIKRFVPNKLVALFKDAE